MRKNIVCILILTLVLVGTSLLAFKTLQGLVNITSGNTLVVGPLQQYATIQSAINNASDGDTIEVINASTPYYENVVVNRSVTITPYSGNHQSPRVVGGFNVTSSNVTINNIIIRDGNYGIQLTSSGNTISGNTITNNTLGLYVGGNSNILRSNTITGNGLNFGMTPTYQDVDTSNTINGKPICYWVNKTGGHIPYNAGYVCIINCSDVTVENLVLPNNYEGVQVAYSSQITIRNCSTVYTSRFVNYIVLVNVSHSSIEDTDIEGGQSDNTIWLVNSDNNNITNNTIEVNARAALWLDGSNNNEIANNVIGDIYLVMGIGISYSLQNSVVANNISTPSWCVGVEYSNGTIFFHNNFLNLGANFGVISNCSVRSDNGYEGNYYSNYAGEDRNGDGIIDANHTMSLPSNGIWIDNCPLLQPWSAQREFSRNEYDRAGHVIAIPDPQNLTRTIELYTSSNSTLASFNYTQLAFTLNATCGYDGFLNMTIPRNWIDGPFSVTIDKLQVSASVAQDENCSYVYFNYTMGAHMIEISGTKAGSIPGDLNGDGKVNLQDLVLLAKYYGANKYP